MKIYVKDGNTGHKIRLALPSRLIFGKFGQAIVKCAIKSELKHNSSDEECVADTNIDADGLGMAELDDTTSFDTFDEEERIRRLKESRGYSDEKIAGIMANQASEEEFRNFTDCEINNSGTEEETSLQIQKLLCGKDNETA